LQRTVNPPTIGLRGFESLPAHMNSKDYIIIGVTTLAIFAGTYAVLSIFGFAPKQLRVQEEEYQPRVTYIDDGENREQGTENREEKILLPDKITISKIGVDSEIQKPQSQEVSVLDAALNKGAVYYPGSGTINFGNMFLFGHSTGFSIVNNQAYKTFNNLDDLVAGDEIEIESNGRTFIYKVQKVTLLDESAAFVDFSKTDQMLTLSTCNTFGQKQERWVVEAIFDREV
jgi:LPXTG-site transpeptidase (sortase) family protein